MPLTCPSCGNDRNFLVKTLQMHVVQLRDDSRVEASEEGRPAEDAEPGTVLEVYQQGYRINGQILRPARVVVAQ